MAETKGRGIPGPAGLTDEDIASDLLVHLKYMVACYGRAAVEAAGQTLNQNFRHLGQHAEASQRRLWQHMYRKGWYGVHWATDGEIRKTYEMARSSHEEIQAQGSGEDIRTNRRLMAPRWAQGAPEAERGRVPAYAGPYANPGGRYGDGKEEVRTERSEPPSHRF